MPERIGIFICACGPNIRDAMDLEAVAAYARKLDHVVLCETCSILCDPDGKERIGEAISKRELTRVVVAACSPREHENTFWKVLADAGLNPFLLQMANIREQCAWVIKDRALATKKAMIIISGAVQRVLRHEPISPPAVTCRTEVLVIGAGVAGISAARSLAREGRQVFLVEKAPCIGGHAARYDDLFYDMSCASCLLSSRLDDVLNHEKIRVFINSRVTDMAGFFGHFIARIKTRASKVDPEKCIGCGACIAACPVSVPNAFNENLNDRKAIDIPYPGALPNLAGIDSESCLRARGNSCGLCRDACVFDAIDFGQTDSEQEITAGAIIVATGFDLFDPKRNSTRGFPAHENVFTSMELERMLSEAGPTEGQPRLADGEPPTRVALVPGALLAQNTTDPAAFSNPPISDISCALMAKYAKKINQRLPDCLVTGFVSELGFSGSRARRFFQDAFSSENNSLCRLPKDCEITATARHGRPKSRISGKCSKESKMDFDMVVLIPEMAPGPDTKELCELLNISRDSDGFFLTPEIMMEPVSSDRRGIFVAGASRGPKTIPESVADGLAAAGEISSVLVEGRPLEVVAESAEINEDLCSGCGICEVLCSQKAITYDKDRNVRRVNPLICKGCGSCAAGCPSGAIHAFHYEDCQISAEIKGLLKD